MPSISKLAIVLAAIDSLYQRKQRPSRYHLQQVAGDIYAVKGATTCSTSTRAESAELVTDGYSTRLRNLIRCRKHKFCPICRDIWLVQHRRKLAHLVESWAGTMTAITLTLAHHPRETYGSVLARLQAARRAFMASPELQGYGRRPVRQSLVMAVETTLGEDGWHPHFHGVVFSTKPLSASQRNGLAACWRRCVRSVGGRAGTRAALIQPLGSKDAARRACGYTFKPATHSAFDVLAVAADEDSPVAARDVARDLWRDYCIGALGQKNMRFVSVAGEEIKVAWSAQSSDKRTKAAAGDRMFRLVQEWDAANDGVPGSPFFDEIIRRTQFPVQRLPAKLRGEIKTLWEHLAEAVDRRDELGYYDDLDPIGDVEELLDQLWGLMTTVPPDRWLKVGDLDRDDLRKLRKSGPSAREALERAHKFGTSDLSRLFSAIRGVLGLPEKPYPTVGTGWVA